MGWPKFYFKINSRNDMLRNTIALALSLAVLVHAQAWDAQNNPSLFSAKYQYQFGQLPVRHTLPTDITPWSDDYYPSYRGGIAYRWLDGSETAGRNYTLYSLQDLKSMSQKDLKTLSPAEKFDILHGRYDYPTVHLEWQ